VVKTLVIFKAKAPQKWLNIHLKPSSLFDFLKKSSRTASTPTLPQVDMHAHILPGIDDGAATMEDSLAMIEGMYDLGYQHLIATPHIYKEFYPNTTAIIQEKLRLVREALTRKGLNIRLDSAAEYFLDDHFDRLLQDDDIMVLPGGYVLVEMSFVAEHPNFRQTLFEMQMKGYKPILAHPERYPYLNQNIIALENLVDGGCRLQLNLLSLTGHYGKGPQLAAERLLKHKLISMVGTDAHNIQHVGLLSQLQKSSAIRRLLQDYEFENRKLG
jgi:protein-tyrosine phosphatase